MGERFKTNETSSLIGMVRRTEAHLFRSLDQPRHLRHIPCVKRFLLSCVVMLLVSLVQAEQDKNSGIKNELDAYLSFRMGHNYEHGFSVPKDETKALQYYREAAEGGDALGQWALCLMYANGKGGLIKDEVQAEKWSRKAVEQGPAVADKSFRFALAVSMQ
jgi:TPR repeat protein